MVKIMTRAARDVLEERHRQVLEEGFTAEHDDKWVVGQLAWAALGYLSPIWGDSSADSTRLPPGWPWDNRWWRPRDRRANLVRGIALALAELERLDRVAERAALPPSLWQVPNIPLREQTMEQLCAERNYWQMQMRAAEHWGSGAYAAAGLRNACQREIDRRLGAADAEGGLAEDGSAEGGSAEG